MKIEDLLLFPTDMVRSQSCTKDEGDFAQILAEALRVNQTETAKTAGVTPAPEITDAEDAGSLRGLLEATLAHLRLFQESLGRPGIPLKNISPLVDRLEEDSRRLQAVSEKLPSASPWRQILEEAAALSWVECFKFRRGDYV